MSELKLSTALIRQLLDVLERHDQAAGDQHIAAQYLSAVVGFLLGQHDKPDPDRDQTIEELAAFIKHVANDVQAQRQHAPPTPPPQEAFGIWKPKN